MAKKKLTPEQLEKMQNDLYWIKSSKVGLENHARQQRSMKKYPSSTPYRGLCLQLGDRGVMADFRFRFSEMTHERKQKIEKYVIRMIKEEQKERIEHLQQMGVEIE
jgi:hypothetical protein